jgi:lysosomal Pro-X carboxypeptidase
MTRCELRLLEQPLDHFSFGNTETFQQRYFLCALDQFAPHKPALYFYTGNEANVELYVNATGVMWETSQFNPELNAALVFAEHRYYGGSRPKSMDDSSLSKKQRLAFLTSEQALADYAVLIRHVREVDLRRVADTDIGRVGDYNDSDNGDTGKDGADETETGNTFAERKHRTGNKYNPEKLAVIVFGGSYGGMLSTWMRLKYPHLVDGAVAGSAPVWSFMGEVPSVNPNTFASGVTFDASAWGGSGALCEGTVRAGFAELIGRIDDESLSEESSQVLTGTNTRYREPSVTDSYDSVTKALRLCPASAIKNSQDILTAAYWLQDSFDYLAMGNFPYPDSYILMGDGELPAFPFRKACGGELSDPATKRKGGSALIAALADFADVYYNYSRDLKCFEINCGGPNSETAEDTNLWDWQFCTEMFMPSARDGVVDMFWRQPWNLTEQIARCYNEWGVVPKQTWANTLFGGRRLHSASNIVWSNGALDPWSGLGVSHTTDFDGVLNPERSLEAIWLQNGAHHLDFFWSREDDDDELVHARATERELITRWIKKKHSRHGSNVAVE